MRLLALVIVCLVASIIFVTPGVHALTKEQAASHYAQRTKALAEMKQQNTTDVYNYPKTLNIITIDLDAGCLTLIKNNYTSKCPDYKKLVTLDTTNKYAGKFVDKPYYHRDRPMLQKWYAYPTKGTNPIICVDCPSLATLQAGWNIIIVPKLFYKINADSKIVNNTRYVYADRYVENCQTARIVYSQFLLNDTINYFKSGCTKTGFNATQVIYMPPSKPTYDGNWYKHLKFLEEAKKLAKTNCLKSKEC